METNVADREFIDLMEQALGKATLYHAVVARGRFAVRIGPMPFAIASALMDWGTREHVPVMVTAALDANWAPAEDWQSFALRMFGETREEREALAGRGKVISDALQEIVLRTARLTAKLAEDSAAQLGGRRVELAPEIASLRDAIAAVEVALNVENGIQKTVGDT